MTSNKEIGIWNLKLFIKIWVILLPMYQGRSFLFSERKKKKKREREEFTFLSSVRTWSRDCFSAELYNRV